MHSMSIVTVVQQTLGLATNIGINEKSLSKQELNGFCVDVLITKGFLKLEAQNLNLCVTVFN